MKQSYGGGSRGAISGFLGFELVPSGHSSKPYDLFEIYWKNENMNTKHSNGLLK